jgi:hypothetical protein
VHCRVIEIAAERERMLHHLRFIGWSRMVWNVPQCREVKKNHSLPQPTAIGDLNIYGFKYFRRRSVKGWMAFASTAAVPSGSGIQAS